MNREIIEHKIYLVLKKIYRFFFRKKNISKLEHLELAFQYSEVRQIMYLGGGNACNHMSIWIQLFEGLSDFCLVFRNKGQYEKALVLFPNFNSIYVKSTLDMEMLYEQFSNLKRIFYLSTPAKNNESIRFNEYTHIFLGHGDSEKKSSATKVLRMYDELWVAGKAHKDRFETQGINCSSINFVEVGYPPVRKLLELSNTSKKKNEIKKCLYLPTWEGSFIDQTYSSVLFGEIILDKLLQYKIEKIGVKFHPFTGHKNNEYLAKVEFINNFFYSKMDTNFTSYKPDVSVENIIPDYDFFICDCSAVVTYCLAFNKPIFIYINKNIENISSKMPYDVYTYTFSSPQEFEHVLKKFIEKGDYKRNEREKAIEYYLNKTKTLDNTFYKKLREEY